MRIVVVCVAVAIVIGVIWYCIDYNKNLQQKLQKSPAFSAARFYRFATVKGQGYIGYYSFEVDGQTIYGEAGDRRYRNFDTSVFRKTFPVLYNSEQPSSNRILVYPYDFSRFNLSFPDSLRWVTSL